MTLFLFLQVNQKADYKPSSKPSANKSTALFLGESKWNKKLLKLILTLTHKIFQFNRFYFASTFKS